MLRKNVRINILTLMLASSVLTCLHATPGQESIIPKTKTELAKQGAKQVGRFIVENPKAIWATFSTAAAFSLVGIAWYHRKKISEAVGNSFLVWQDTMFTTRSATSALNTLAHDTALYLQSDDSQMPRSLQRVADMMNDEQGQRIIHGLATALFSSLLEARSRAASRSVSRAPSRGPSRAQTPFAPINPEELADRLNELNGQSSAPTPQDAEQHDLMNKLLDKFLSTQNGRTTLQLILGTVIEKGLPVYLDHQAGHVDSGAGISPQVPVQDEPFSIERIFAAAAAHPELTRELAEGSVASFVLATSLQPSDAAARRVRAGLDASAGVIRPEALRPWSDDQVRRMAQELHDQHTALITQQDRQVVKLMRSLTSMLRENPYSCFLLVYGACNGITQTLIENKYVFWIVIVSISQGIIEMVAYTPWHGMLDRLKTRAAAVRRAETAPILEQEDAQDSDDEPDEFFDVAEPVSQGAIWFNN